MDVKEIVDKHGREREKLPGDFARMPSAVRKIISVA